MKINGRASSLFCRLLLLVLVGTMGVSCTRKLEDSIIGKWRNVDNSETVEFLKDGTIMIVNPSAGIVGGRYTFVDKDRIKVELGGMASVVGPMLVTVSIKDNLLTKTMPDGSTLNQYRREK